MDVRGLTRNLEIGNTVVWILIKIWVLDQKINHKLGINILNKCLLESEKHEGSNLCSFIY